MLNVLLPRVQADTNEFTLINAFIDGGVIRCKRMRHLQENLFLFSWNNSSCYSTCVFITVSV